MPIIAKFEDESVELTTLDADGYSEIDSKDIQELAAVAADIVDMLGDDEQSHQEFVTMAKRLTVFWYNSKGHKFEQEPSESFLIYLVEAYVAKHDGQNIAEAILAEQPQVVLSQRSVALYEALHTQALHATQDESQQERITQTFDVLKNLIAASITKKYILPRLLQRIIAEQLFGGNPERPSVDADGNPSDPSSAAALQFMMMLMMMMGGDPAFVQENDETVLAPSRDENSYEPRVRIEELPDTEPSVTPKTFAQAKQQLSALTQDQFMGTPVFERVKNLMLLATRQQFEGCSEDVLLPIMVNTRMLLNKEMDVATYKDYAKNLQGSPSAALKVLGIAMMAVATVFLCHFVAAAALGAGILTTLGLGGAGVGFMGTGYSMFAKKPNGMCQAALDTAETYNTFTAK